MLGGMLAGHDQCPGESQSDANGKQCKLFCGMSSRPAQEKYGPGLASYRASEGKKISVPYRRDVSTTVQDILGGLRSACFHTGSSELDYGVARDPINATINCSYYSACVAEVAYLYDRISLWSLCHTKYTFSTTSAK